MASTPRKQSPLAAALALGLLVLLAVFLALGGCRESLLKTIQEDVEKAEYVGAPKLVVTYSTTVIEQGQSYGIFGSVPIDAVNAQRQFIILNDGDENLILSGAVAVTLEGDAEFQIAANAKKTYAPGESDDFYLTFDPEVQDSFSTTLTIESNDATQSVFSFTVTGTGALPDSARPEIVSKSPDNGATQVPVNSNVSVTFSEEMKANVASDAIFRLYAPAAATTLAATYSRDDDGDVVILNPDADLLPGAQYTAEIREDAMDLAGNLLVGGTYQWTFTTLPLPGAPALASPADNSIDQALAPTLDWSDCANAESYEVFWSTSASFGSTPSATVTGNPPASQCTTSSLARGTKYYWKAVAVNSSGKASSTATFSFTTIPNPPAAPGLNSPPNASGAGTSVTLSWFAASGAVFYNVFCDANTNPTTLKTTTTALSCTLPTSYSTRYYWKVVAVNGGGSTASAVRYFDTLYAPGAPTLSSPANGATGLGTTVTVSWAAGSGGAPASYKLYCDTNADPTTDKGSTTSTSLAIAVSYATRYYWKVEATNAAGSTTSTIRSFDTLYPPAAPALSAPASGATGLTSPVTLSWAAGGGGPASKYELFCDTNADPATTATTTTSTSYAMTVSYSTRYYWKVKAINAAGSATSAIRSFDTLYPPGAPALSAPANAATGLLSPVALSWTAGGGGAVSSYKVYCDANNPPKTLVTTTTSASYSMAASYNARYYWQVTATNAAGSASSTVRTFDTLYKPTAAPTLGVPADGATEQPLLVRFTWSAVSGATSYDVYLGTSSSPALYKSGVTTLNMVPTSPLAYKTTYYWRVVAKNAAGTGPVQTARKLITRLDRIWPIPGSTGVPRSPIECDWLAVTGATRYVLEGSTNGTTFAELYDGAVHFFYNVDPPTPLPANTTYYWRVTPYDKAGPKPVIGPYTFTTVP